MSPAGDFERAIATIEKELLAIDGATTGLSMSDNYDAYRKANSAAVSSSIEHLKQSGAHCSVDGPYASIRWKGLHATSTIGFPAALHNWLIQAGKRLSQATAAMS